MDFDATHEGGGWCKHCGDIIEHHSRYVKDGRYTYKCRKQSEKCD